MDAAYSVAEWSDLFVATAGAAAALAGLLFVAISINVERILKYEGLPERALEALLLLLGVVVVSVLCLAPGIGDRTLGWLLLAEAVVVGLAVLALTQASARPAQGRGRARVYVMLVFTAVGTIPFLVGAISLLAEAGGGLYWVLGGIIGVIVGAVINAWVLLVEILR